MIDQDGEQAGIVSIQQALDMAEQAALDLVEISPNAEPPVCRIMNYGKFLYEKSKTAKEQKKKQKVVQVKEIKFRPGTDEGDYQVKLRSLIRFLEDGDKAKITAARKIIAKLVAAFAKFEQNYRAQWYERNKTFGYEVMQIRLAGQAARWRELDRRLRDLAAGKIKSIPELEEKTVKRAGVHGTYQFLATASVYF